MNQNTNLAIARAMASVANAIPQAEADPTRPVYHFRPPANWMNDPNGTIYHNGYYHLFYQHNPYADSWGHMHWGHARSRDLLHWEHLPIALWPSLEQGEGHCFSGCAAIGPDDQPMLIYTSVSPRAKTTDDTGTEPAQQDNTQWLALGDPEWITWEKWDGNPLLTLGGQGAPHFGGAWRDPYIFHEGDRTFLVLGADREETQEVALYEADDDSLLRWTYRGPLLQTPTQEGYFYECPNFIKLGDKWLLLTSPYDLVHYVVGTFDLDTLTFTPETEGLIDYGLGDADQIAQSDTVPNYYATNTLFDPDGRCILLAWVRGFVPERGWNGILALPRVLTLGPDNRPRQMPQPELHTLRGEQLADQADISLNGKYFLDDVQGDTLELKVTLDLGTADKAGIKLRCPVNSDSEGGISIHFDGKQLDVAGTLVPIQDPSRLELHIFLDRAVLEIFVNGGQDCVTRVVYPPTEDIGVLLFAEGGEATVTTLMVWQIDPIW